MLTKEQLQERTLLVRLHEANCNILFPTPPENGFRIAVMLKLTRQFGLGQLRRSTAVNILHKPVPKPV